MKKKTNYDPYWEKLCYYLSDTKVQEEDKLRFPNLDWDKIQEALDELPKKLDHLDPEIKKTYTDFTLDSCREVICILDESYPWIRMRVSPETGKITYEKRGYRTWSCVSDNKFRALRKKIVSSREEKEEYTVECVLSFDATRTYRVDTYEVFYECGATALVEKWTVIHDTWDD